MSRPLSQVMTAATQRAHRSWTQGAKATWWSQHREASLNWLALGLLLAAWNASDDDAHLQAKPRPEALRGYSHISVRAVQRAVTTY